MTSSTPYDRRPALPLAVQRSAGRSDGGHGARLMVRDAARRRVGFVALPGGHLFLQAAWEAQRAAVIEGLAAAGVEVAGPRGERLAALPFGADLQLWPHAGPIPYISVHHQASVADERGPDVADDDWLPADVMPVDAEGRCLDPDTLEVLPAWERARYFPGSNTLDIGWSGWWDDVVGLLCRAGLVDPAAPPRPGAQRSVSPVPRWRPGLRGVPLQATAADRAQGLEGLDGDGGEDAEDVEDGPEVEGAAAVGWTPTPARRPSGA